VSLGAQISHGKGQFWWKRAPIVKYIVPLFATSAVKKLKKVIYKIHTSQLTGLLITHRHTQCMQKHNLIQDLVNATQRNLQYWYTGTFCCECELCKTAEPIDLPFGLWPRVVLRKHKFNRIRQVASMCPHGSLGGCQSAAMGGHIDATWRIRLNRPSAAAMRPYAKLL